MAHTSPFSPIYRRCVIYSNHFRSTPIEIEMVKINSILNVECYWFYCSCCCWCCCEYQCDAVLPSRRELKEFSIYYENVWNSFLYELFSPFFCLSCYAIALRYMCALLNMKSSNDEYNYHTLSNSQKIPKIDWFRQWFKYWGSCRSKRKLPHKEEKNRAIFSFGRCIFSYANGGESGKYMKEKATGGEGVR